MPLELEWGNGEDGPAPGLGPDRDARRSGLPPAARRRGLEHPGRDRDRVQAQPRARADRALDRARAARPLLPRRRAVARGQDHPAQRRAARVPRRPLRARRRRPARGAVLPAGRRSRARALRPRRGARALREGAQDGRRGRRAGADGWRCTTSATCSSRPGAPTKAVACFTEMLHLAWRFDNLAKAGAAYSRLARGQRRLGKYDAAMEHLRRAHELFERSRDDRGIASTLDDMGRVQLAPRGVRAGARLPSPGADDPARARRSPLDRAVAREHRARPPRHRQLQGGDQPVPRGARSAPRHRRPGRRRAVAVRSRRRARRGRQPRARARDARRGAHDGAGHRRQARARRRAVARRRGQGGDGAGRRRR